MILCCLFLCQSVTDVSPYMYVHIILVRFKFFGKELLTRLTTCLLCIQVDYLVFLLFPSLVFRAGLGF